MHSIYDYVIWYEIGMKYENFMKKISIKRESSCNGQNDGEVMNQSQSQRWYIKQFKSLENDWNKIGELIF